MEKLFLNQFVKTVIDKFTEPLMKRIVKISKDEWEKFKIDFDVVFTKYIKKSYDKYCKIKTILYKTEPQYIYDFFVAPTIMKQPAKVISTENINNILEISNFIIIQGTGGIGKSTLLKHLFINELEKEELIPVFIELKDINVIDDDYDIIDIIFEKLNNLGSTIKKDYIEYALSSGCFLFLFDGYDEILSNKKDEFFKKLDKFCDKYTDNYFIISSRPYSEFVEFQRFTVLKALPLSKEQSIEMVSKINYEQTIKERFIESLENNLYDDYKSFASNPLLLNIMLLTFDNYADIPEKLHLFYSNAFETLYSKHDATKAGYKREMLSKLSYDSFRRVFSYFCFITYKKGTTEFTYQDLKEVFNKIKIPRLEFDIENYIYDIVNSLCVIYKDGFSYIFAHRSFQEYFTAVFLKELSDENLQKIGIEMIKSDPSRASNDNVFSMLYDMAEEKVEKNILLPVLDTYDASNLGEDRYWYYFKGLVNTIRFSMDKEDELQLWLRTDASEDDCLIEFIYTFSKKYNYVTSEKMYDYQRKERDLFQHLVDKYEYYIDEPFDVIDIIDYDEDVRKMIRMTWIGNAVLKMTKLKATIINNLEESEVSIDSLLEL